ncbi:hypothetical protein SUGI_0006670 [Cryptomeria japonica]|uniref:small ribosomal subunit protein mS80 (rPPR6)-like n=1 Tax=Cryptomeria japonica TaxID=3369 RepID=UPI002408E824|nr:small ribosomal subunit protein mS80 (rPPR6)-like [Cryptomeria japonica]GLJ04921.1 hypothetical protein SUGI_0006670 [Cryptomeria japonica]
MWKSKAGLIFRRVSSAFDTSPSFAVTNRVRIIARSQQSQVVSVVPIRFYSYAKNIISSNTNTQSNSPKEDSYSSDKPQIESILPTNDSENTEKCEEDAEKVVSLLKKRIEEVEDLEKELETLDIEINGKMIAKVVKFSGFKTQYFFWFFRWALKQPDYVPSSQIMDTIALVICNRGGRKWLKSLIEELAESQKGIVTATALNTLIDHLACAKRPKEALEVFQQFDKFDCKPGPKSYFVTIQGLCSASMFEEAFSVFEEMEMAGYFPGNGSTASKIIRWFCKGGRTKDAHMIYLRCMDKGKFPRMVSINALVDSLCNEANTPEVAAEVLRAIPRKERKHGLKAHFTVVQALCKTQKIEEAEALLSQMVKAGPRPDRATYNTIITGVCKAEKAERATELLEEMTSRRIRPDIYSFNVIMASFARAGKMQEACDIFSKAKEAKIKFHYITYKILIDGFCRLGDPKTAHQYFSELKESGRPPKMEIYSNLVRAYIMQGLDWQTAKKLLHEMELKGHSHTPDTQSLVDAANKLEEEALLTEARRIIR